jgi:hypothetical protein
VRRRHKCVLEHGSSSSSSRTDMPATDATVRLMSNCRLRRRLPSRTAPCDEREQAAAAAAAAARPRPVNGRRASVTECYAARSVGGPCGCCYDASRRVFARVHRRLRGRRRVFINESCCLMQFLTCQLCRSLLQRRRWTPNELFSEELRTAGRMPLMDVHSIGRE